MPGAMVSSSLDANRYQPAKEWTSGMWESYSPVGRSLYYPSHMQPVTLGVGRGIQYMQSKC